MRRWAWLGMALCLGACDDADEAQAGGQGACVATAPTLAHRRLRASGTALIDAAGRQVLLRGVNAGGRSKLPPFLPFPFAESARPDQADAPPFDEAVAALRCHRQGAVALAPVTAEEVAAVDAIAAREHISRSEAIRRALAGFAA